MKPIRRKLIILAMTLLLLPGLAFASEVPGPNGDNMRPPDHKPIQDGAINILHLYGDNRYETALNAASFWHFTDSVVIASGENAADTLFSGPLAAQLKAPILLTQKNTLPEGILTNLEKKEVKHVYLIGGEQTIAASVEKEIKDSGYPVTRVGGKNRAETAQMLSELTETLANQTGMKNRPWIEVGATQFADTLAASPYVYAYRQANGSHYFMPYAGHTGSLVISGTNAVPTLPEEQRIQGEDRYATALAIAKEYQKLKGQELGLVVLVNGTNYPDALAAAPVASLYGGVVLLTPPDHLDARVAEFLENNTMKNVLVLGGDNSISPDVVKEVREIIEVPGVK